VLVTPFPKLGPVPGFTSYVAGALAFAEVGCVLAGDDGIRGVVRAAVDAVPELADRTIAATWAPADAQVDGLDRETVVMALASGPFMAPARHAVRKVLETSQLVALSQDTEEYAHDEYSAVDGRFCVLLHAPPDRTWNRSAEVAGYLERLGVRLGVVDPADRPVPTSDPRSVHYGVPACDPLVAPLLYSLPGQVVSHLLAVRLGGSMYGMADPVKRADGDPQIYDSQIVVA
jgi:glucosamine--fructose-6-phosphate aminotransferase (isomerizing)